MLYYLFTWLDKEFHISGANLFSYISFRAAMAVVLSLLIATIYGKRLINFLKRKQIGKGAANIDTDLHGHACSRVMSCSVSGSGKITTSSLSQCKPMTSPGAASGVPSALTRNEHRNASLSATYSVSSPE